jgi:DNA repair exonuclease SbcCD ATPase subunit
MAGEKETSTFRILLQKVPGKPSEEALVRLLTEKLRLLNEDALKITQSAPIILFKDLTAKQAEQINLVLKTLGAKSVISSSPNDLKIYPYVNWPEQIDLEILAKIVPERVAPAAPVPLPSLPSSTEATPSAILTEKWRNMYSDLQKSYLDALDRLKKKEEELSASQEAIEKLRKERREAPPEGEDRFAKERGELGERLEALDREREKMSQAYQESQRALEALEKEKERLEEELRNFREERNRLAKEQGSLAQAKDQLHQTYQDSQRELDALERETRGLREERDRLSRERQEFSDRAEFQTREKERLGEAYKETQQKLEASGREKARFEEEVRSLRGRVEILKKELAGFDDLKILMEKEEPYLEVVKTKAKLEEQIETNIRKRQEIQSRLKVIESLVVRQSASARAQR